MTIQFTPPPTYAAVVLYDENAQDVKQLLRSVRFNPIWLKWFVDVAQFITQSGGGGGGGPVTSVTATAPITSTGGTTPNIAITGAALTKTDDTNVTLTLGGTPATGLVKAIALTLGWTGTLSTARGGTGNGSGNAATVTTNANLTGPITSVGNATAIASQTGTGTKFVMDTAATVTGFTAAFSGREQESQGAVVASANNLTLGTDGNYFQISGSTQINLISSTGWQGGSQITLKFNGNPAIKQNFGTSGVFKTIFLAGAVDFTVTAPTCLTLVYDSTDARWYEVCRSVN